MPDVNPWRALATQYWQLGFNIIPLGADKRPIVTGVAANGKALHWRWEDWQTRRQSAQDLRQILRPAWWTQVRGIAGIAGLNDLVCLDIDTAGHDQLAAQTLVTLLEQLPPECAAWAVVTPGGGRHLWLHCPGLQLAKGRLDQPLRVGGPDDHSELRHTGHYAVLPGSWHPNGGQYTWLTNQPATPPVSVTPDVLLAAYHAITTDPPVKTAPVGTTAPAPTSTNGTPPVRRGYAATALANEAVAVARAAPGTRNDQLNTAAFNLGQLVGGGELDETAVTTALLDAALACGLGESEAHATIASGLTAGQQHPRQPPTPTGALTAHADLTAGFTATPPDPAAILPALAPPASSTAHNSWPYAEKNGRLVFLRETRDDVVELPIADFTARNIEEILEEDGSKTFTIVGSGLRGGAFRLEIPAETIGQPRVLRSLLEAAAGAKDPVYPTMTEHLPTAIKLMTRDGELFAVRRFHRTGWHAGRFLLPGRAAYPGNRIELDRKLPYGFDDPANFTPDPDRTAHALTALLNAIDGGLALTVLTMLLQAPLQRLAGWTNRYGIFIQGRTGSLKTSFAQTMMGIYGPRFADTDLLLKWGEGATRNAIMTLAARAHDLPLLIDNYKPNTGGGSKDFVALIHNILEGGDKDRLTSAAELRQAKAVHCFPLITGEDVPDQDAASVARVLVLPFPWQPGQPNELLAYAQEHHRHLQAIGAGWLDWLENKDNHAAIHDVTAQLWNRLRFWTTELQRHSTGMANALRVATNLAANDLTFQVALLHPTIGPLLRPFATAHHTGLLTIAQGMAQRTADALEAHQFLGALRELIVTRQYILQPRQLPENDLERDRLLGWYDQDGVYLLPALAVAAAKRLLGPGSLPISVQALYSQLEGLGKIASQGRQETAKILRIGNKTVRVLHLKIAAFNTETGGETNSILEELGL